MSDKMAKAWNDWDKKKPKKKKKPETPPDEEDLDRPLDEIPPLPLFGAQMIEQYRMAPASAPLRWSNVLPELRPYLDFREEWLNSPLALSIETLKRRWMEIHEGHEIELYFASGRRTMERNEVQNRRALEQIQYGNLAPQMATPEMLALSNYKRLAEIQERIEDIRNTLHSKKIWRKMTIFSAGIMNTEWGWDDLLPADETRLDKDLREWMKLERLYQGQATEIQAMIVQGEAKESMVELVEAAAKRLQNQADSDFERLQRLALGAKKVDAVSVEPEKPVGRLYEALPVAKEVSDGR